MPIQNKAIPYLTRTRGDTAFANYVAVIWKTLVIVGGLAVLIQLLWGALNWIMSGSDPERLKRAKNQMSNGVFGLVILALSYLIIKLIETITSLNILDPIWPTP